LFLGALDQAHVIPVSAAVSLKDFNGLTEVQREKLESPYHVAFQEVTFNIAFATANKGLQTAKQVEDFFGNRVAMTYAKLKKVTGPAEKLWEAIKAGNPAAGNWMSSYAVAEPFDTPPLQAIDIWAYSLGHMQEYHPPKRIEARIAFDFFVHSTFQNQNLGHKFFTFFDRKEMDTAVPHHIHSRLQSAFVSPLVHFILDGELPRRVLFETTT
jgi:hypothetical protein